MAQQSIPPSPMLLLEQIISAYPIEGGGSCVKAAVFHSQMLNDFVPRYQALVADTKAHVVTESDDETPIKDVVVTEEE